MHRENYSLFTKICEIEKNSFHSENFVIKYRKRIYDDSVRDMPHTECGTRSCFDIMKPMSERGIYMSQIIAVTAGKGGTGKSTTSANVASGLAALGKKTLVVELDFGLRCLDIMLGIKDKVKHDIGEYLEGKIDILTATTKVDRVDNLYLVCATRNPFMDINPEKIMGVCEEMRKHFDYIIIDTAGVGSSVFSVIKAAELILMVTTPDTVCVRDGAILSDFLYVKNCTNQRLVINKVSPNFKDEEILYDLDEVMDSVGIPLIGVVPEDQNIKICGAKGQPLPTTCGGYKAYSAIARRILGEDVPLTIKID